MNDIIILGNGFDLAHGLATGYKDYVREMIIDSSRTFAQQPLYSDSPFRLKEYSIHLAYEEGYVAPYLFEQKLNDELAALYLQVAR